MATVVFSSDLQRHTGGVTRAEVTARDVRALYAKLCRMFPALSAEMLEKYSLAMDGALVAKPLLETFGEHSELVFVARIGAG